MGFDQPTHWIVILILAGILFFGYKKLPEMARSAGRSMRVFKTELKGMADDDDARSRSGEAAQASPPAPLPPAGQPQQMPPVQQVNGAAPQAGYGPPDGATATGYGSAPVEQPTPRAD